MDIFDWLHSKRADGKKWIEHYAKLITKNNFKISRNTLDSTKSFTLSERLEISDMVGFFRGVLFSLDIDSRGRLFLSFNAFVTPILDWEDACIVNMEMK